MTQHTAHVNWLEVIGAVLIVFAVIGIVKLPGLLLKLLTQVLKDYLAVWVWRHFSGAHYHGERRTDATWLTHGSTTKRQYDHGGFMDRWEHKPRAHRAAWRWLLTFAFFAVVYSLIADFRVTCDALGAMAVYGAVAAGFVIEARWRLRMHRRAILTPTVKSLAVILRVSPHSLRRSIHIDPENISDEGEIGWWEIPDHITPGDDQQKTIGRVFDAHLPVDSETVFKLSQSPKIAVIQAAQKPPPMVTFGEMLAAMGQCRAGEVVIGLDRAREKFTASLTDLEDPHWGFDVNTKFGKSNFLGITAAQILHQDPLARAFIVDPKRSSLIDFVGSPLIPDRPVLPGVMMANNPGRPGEMWKVIKTARVLLDKRTEEAEVNRGKRFPCALVIVDELNQFGDIMKEMWDDMKKADKKLPKDDREGLDGMWPGWADIMAILRMGRFVNMHILACAQDFRDDAFGGRGGRNYLGFKGMAGYNPSQWEKFMQSKPVPVMQNHSGRWIFSDGHDETWVQVMFADAEHDRAAYDYAAYGRELYTDELHPVSVHDDVPASYPASILETQTDGHAVHAIDGYAPEALEAPGDDTVTGREPAAEYLGIPLYRFEKRRYRTPVPGEFKKSNRPAWHKKDLDSWNARWADKDDDG